MPTYLEKLIDQQVNATLAATMGRKTDQVVEGLVDEILRDPQTKARWLAMIQRAFDRAFQSLDQAVPREKPNAMSPEP
jgi:hypothetical protein